MKYASFHGASLQVMLPVVIRNSVIATGIELWCYTRRHKSMANSADLSMFIVPIGFLVLGLFVGISNLILGISVAKYSALRQSTQHYLLMALAFADAANLCAYPAAGIYRLWVITTGNVSTSVTPVECLLKPHTIMWLFSYPFSVLMLVILSADRLFLVSFPSTYLLSLPSPRYAQVLVITGFVCTSFMALMGILGVLLSPQVASESAVCLTPIARDSPVLINRIFVYYYEHTSYLAFLSVLMFAAVPLLHKLRSQNQQDASQRRMTVTVAVSCLCTLLLYCIPDRMGYVIYYRGYTNLAWAFWFLAMTNPIANIIIYQLRHWEMRQALKGLITCKPMPPLLTLWTKPKALISPIKKPDVIVEPRKNEDQVLEVREL